MTSSHALEAEVDEWINGNWDLSITVREWWRRLANAGLSYPAWPLGVGGRAATDSDSRVISRALGRARVIGPPLGHVAATLAAPTLLRHGTEEQISVLVRDIALGEAAWCQLFSEPGSGSDLAGLGTRALPDGDGWRVTGQKVWNSGADSSDLGMLLARTDIDRTKHEGITFFVIEMHQKGVEVRPLRQMNGQSAFCEVFLNDAKVRRDMVVGELNRGWSVARTTLAYERNSVAGSGVPGLLPARSGRAGDLDVTLADVIAKNEAGRDAKRPKIRTGAVPVSVMLELARWNGKNELAITRQEMARYISQVRVNGWTMQRIAARGGHLTGADGSLAKLTTSRICQDSRELAYRLVGPAGLHVGPESPLAGELQTVALGSPGTRIGGGTDEIQLNVLAERALGLPPEPSKDRNIPYRNLLVGTQKPSSMELDES